LFAEDKMTAGSDDDRRLGAGVVDALRARLPDVSEQVVTAVVAEVPSYSRAFAGAMGDNIRRAVALALDGFLDRVSPDPRGRDTTTAVHNGAYDLGRGEARSGRSMDALLAAYRVGARVAWRGMSQTAVEAGLSAERVVTFAEQVFAYIDELSAVSVAGHSDQLETAGRVRQRLLERLARLLLGRAPGDAVLAAAERAGWDPPDTLTAVLLPPAPVRTVLTALGPAGVRTLAVTDDLQSGEEVVTLLVPDADRAVLRRVLAGTDATLGSTVPWLRAADSHARADRTHGLGLAGTAGDPVDSEEHLVDLVLAADVDARSDLRRRALAPLDAVRPSSRARLEETLRAWLLCQGRRDDAAAMLFVHPQTVRYRMGRLRELFGDRLTDPAAVRELLVALV
jgi:hypothetical protein